MSLPVNKHMSSLLPVCSSKHPGSVFVLFFLFCFVLSFFSKEEQLGESMQNTCVKGKKKGGRNFS